MPVQVFDDVLTPDDIKILIEYLDRDDDRVDHRHDFRSKHPRWDVDVWPQDIIRQVLDKTIGDNYKIYEVDFMRSKIPLKMHVDAVSKSFESLHWAVMICLRANPVGHTVFFDNHWKGHGRNAHFTRQPWSQFSQKFIGRDGSWVEIADIRDFLVTCQTQPHLVTDIEITNDFVTYLEQLVVKRSSPWVDNVKREENKIFALPEPRFSDYQQQVTNYRNNAQFPYSVWQQHLQHQPYDDFHGLTLDQVVEHQPGRVAVWHRSQLHCSSHNHSEKDVVTVFTEHA